MHVNPCACGNPRLFSAQSAKFRYLPPPDSRPRRASRLEARPDQKTNLPFSRSCVLHLFTLPTHSAHLSNDSYCTAFQNGRTKVMFSLSQPDAKHNDGNSDAIAGRQSEPEGRAVHAGRRLIYYSLTDPANDPNQGSLLYNMDGRRWNRGMYHRSVLLIEIEIELTFGATKRGI